MKQLFFLVAGLIAALPANADVNVTQHHNNASRDGLYIDTNFTQANAVNLTRDTAFTGTIAGNVYAQPLYVENGPGGRGMVIAVTASNNVYALDAVTGNVIWSRTNVGTAITSGLPCGNINPIGIIGTPVVDVASRALFLDAETTPGAGTFQHLIYSLNVDTGATNAGWPINVNTALVALGFDSSAQSQRAALGLVGNTLYVPYGGRFGDCGNYRGRLVGVPINSPGTVTTWSTVSTRAGVWGVGGVASDGTNTYVTTGNGSGGATWMGSEAVIRLQPGPVFSGATTDFWTPTNWSNLDSGDTDLGGSGPIVVDVPGATPSSLVLALGKDGNAYLMNRANLGGIAAPLASASVSTSVIIQAGAAYRTAQGSYFVFRHSSTQLRAFHITATNPPTITTAWTVTQSGRGSPFVTSTDGANNVIVWAVGQGGSPQRLMGYDGDTGAVVFNGGGANELMTGTRGYNCNAIVARGRIYVAADNKVYSFRVPPISPILPVNTSRPAAGSFQLSFSSVLGTAFSVYGSPSLANPVATWPRLGGATEVTPGQYQFTDPSAGTQKFYRVTTP